MIAVTLLALSHDVIGVVVGGWLLKHFLSGHVKERKRFYD